MKLLILSDLHLEFAPFTPANMDFDVAVIPGDVAVGSGTIGKLRELFPGKPVIFVPGNHEYYGFQMEECAKEMRTAALKAGIHYLDNNVVMLDGVRFIGSTLWTDFDLFGKEQKTLAMEEAADCMNDFFQIRYGKLAKPFTPADSIGLHLASVQYLETRLEQPFDGKTVVVTHHLPHRNSVAYKFSRDAITPAFASDLSRLMGKASLWIHGHTHTSHDYEVDGTRVICNPRGYLRKTGNFENPDFNPRLVVEV